MSLDGHQFADVAKCLNVSHFNFLLPIWQITKLLRLKPLCPKFYNQIIMWWLLYFLVPSRLDQFLDNHGLKENNLIVPNELLEYGIEASSETTSLYINFFSIFLFL